ncbi:flagellar hook capping FlgD N-terminal domain-containing protein [Aquincola sp. MAHUQ-54]|uniref:Basal-body rod modification protein FlgD n=1 Tax=Aquincola agrisoli TaxID=3119538 RepID=A0AAW9Q420_9BURK
MSTSPVAGVSYDGNGFNYGGATTTKESDGSDRFLKLLVAQMQNQDPLNPMDNAQVTSQIAQINTVTGIEKLNTTVDGLNAQFVQMQALQGATLVGTDVIVAGNKLSTNDAGVVQGGFDLGGAADSVKIEILSGSGQLLDTVNLGAQTTGRHSFDWKPPEGVAASNGQSFRVVAKSGASTVTATPLMRDTVDAVSTGDSLQLQLSRSGTVKYTDIKAFN